MKRLGVNIDHVATVRNARGEIHPDPYKAALFVKKKIISHLKIDVPTYKSNKLPKELDSIPISTPGSRFIK